MNVSANMVIKNEEDFIEQAIRGIKITSEILIYDTGSTDKTIEIIKGLKDEFPIKLFQGDLSPEKARNFLLDKSSGEWIFLVDGDEVWEESEKLLELPRLNPKITAFMFSFDHFITPTKLAEKDKSRTIRFFKKEDGVRFEGKFPFEMLHDKGGILGHPKVQRDNLLWVKDIRFKHYGGIKRGQWRTKIQKKYCLQNETEG